MRLSFIRYPDKKLTPLPPTFQPDPKIEVNPHPPPGSDFYIRLPDVSGLGTFLHYKAYFDYLIENNLVRTVYYTLPKPVLRTEYPDEYYEDLRQFITTTNTSRCQLLPQPEDDRCQYRDLRGIFGIYCKVTPRGNNFRIDATPLINEPYVTLNMKISAINEQQLKELIPRLIECLKRSKYTLVLVGERNATPCEEYCRLPDHISIYKHVVPYLHNYIDKTYDETYVSNKIETIEASATLYTHAKYNIIMNSSGGLTMLSYFGKILGFTTGHSPIEKEIDFLSSHLAHNCNTFIGLLQQYIC